MTRQCDVEGCERRALKNKRLCSRCLCRHDPVPEHHVSAERTCIRCREGFESSWAGERICVPCRSRMHRSDIEAISRGHTPPHYVSPWSL